MIHHPGIGLKTGHQCFFNNLLSSSVLIFTYWANQYAKYIKSVLNPKIVRHLISEKNSRQVRRIEKTPLQYEQHQGGV